MNGFSNSDTFNAAIAIKNTETLYIAARRFNNGFQLRNLIANAQEAGMISWDIDLGEVNCDEILDSVLE